MVEGFTPGSALVGGALIGLAATALYAATGRIAGVSGIVGGLLRAGRGDAAWRLVFLAGLVVGAAATGLVGGAPVLRIGASWAVLVLAGLFVLAVLAGVWLHHSGRARRVPAPA